MHGIVTALEFSSRSQKQTIINFKLRNGDKNFNGEFFFFFFFWLVIRMEKNVPKNQNKYFNKKKWGEKRQTKTFIYKQILCVL